MIASMLSRKNWKVTGVISLATLGAYYFLGNAGCGKNMAEVLKEQPEIVRELGLSMEQKRGVVSSGLESLGTNERADFLKSEIGKLDAVSKYEITADLFGGLEEPNKYRLTKESLYAMPQQDKSNLLEGMIAGMDTAERKGFLTRGIEYCDTRTKQEIASLYSPSLLERVGGWFGRGQEESSGTNPAGNQDYVTKGN